MGRLIRFDKRGSGMSDRPPGVPDLETRIHDVLAVMDAVGSQRALLFGYSEGGPMALLMAATHPERVASLVLYGRLREAAVVGGLPVGPDPGGAGGVHRRAGDPVGLGGRRPQADAVGRRVHAAVVGAPDARRLPHRRPCAR